MARFEDFKLGTSVWVECNSDGEPRWDGAADQGGSGKWICLKVTSIINSMATKEALTVGDDINEWLIPLPGHRAWDDSKPGWYRLSAPGTTEPEGVVDIIWTEAIGKPYRGVEIPGTVLSAAIDRGECKVRRMSRDWPYGKNLNRRLTSLPDGSVCLEFFWTVQGV